MIACRVPLSRHLEHKQLARQPKTKDLVLKVRIEKVRPNGVAQRRAGLREIPEAGTTILAANPCGRAQPRPSAGAVVRPLESSQRHLELHPKLIHNQIFGIQAIVLKAVQSPPQAILPICTSQILKVPFQARSKSRFPGREVHLLRGHHFERNAWPSRHGGRYSEPSW